MIHITDFDISPDVSHALNKTTVQIRFQIPDRALVEIAKIHEEPLGHGHPIKSGSMEELFIKLIPHFDPQVVPALLSQMTSKRLQS